MGEWIKLHRKFLDWEWYNKPLTKIVFLHLLLKANWKDGKFQGHEIKRGSCVVGLLSMSKSLGLTIQNIRTALTHLKSTNEITIKSTNKFSVITIVKYEEYQQDKTKSTSKTTNKLTNNQQTTNNNRRTKEVKKYIKKFFDDEKVNKTFIEYLDVRKEKNMTMSDTVIIRLTNRLEKENNANKLIMLEKAIMGGWKDIYQLKPEEKVKEKRYFN